MITTNIVVIINAGVIVIIARKIAITMRMMTVMGVAVDSVRRDRPRKETVEFLPGSRPETREPMI